MILKRLELQGFKSFANKTIIDFKEGITAVIGPNGSGKSNISDSIRWVLGEQSAKSLRGEKMEDVIFNGTEDKAPLGFAEVSLILNNEEKVFDSEYSEIAITRRVFRTGDSEYYINKKSCRLKDVRELFMDTGIGRDGYSIIGQGKIDEILSSKSEDRRGIFEEAAGIVRYKSRKAESEKKLEKTKENLIRIEDIINEIESQIEPLREQAVKAEKYLNLKNKLKYSEVEFLSSEIKEFKEKLEKIDEQIKNKKEKSYEILNKEKNINCEINMLSEKQNNISLKYEKINEKKYSLINKKDKLNSDIVLYSSKLENESDYKKRTELDIAEIDVSLNNINNELEKYKEEFLKLNSELDIKKSNLENKKSEFESISDEINKLEEDLTFRKDTLLENFNKSSESKMKVSNLESHMEMFEERRRTIEKNNISVISSSNKLNKEIEDINRKYRNSKSEINKYNNLLEEKNIELENDINKSNKFQYQINNIMNESERKISSLNIIKEMQKDYEGYYKGVKNFLNGIKNNEIEKGIEGVLAELITTEEKYEKAIEVALGSSVQNIVTKSTLYAKKSIEFLKERRLGRVTFLPMDNIKGKGLYEREKNILNEKGVLGTAYNLVNYDKNYENIIENILGRIIVVDTIDTMIEVSKKYKNSLRMVTLDGDVMNPSGSMTGGNFRGNALSLIGRSRQLEELDIEINNLKTEYKKIKQDKQKLDEKIVTKKAELDDIKVSLNKLLIDSNTVENELKTLTNRQLEISNEETSFKKELEQIDTEKENIKAKIDEFTDNIEKLNLENISIQKDIDSTVEKIKYKEKTFEEFKESFVSEQVSYAALNEKIKNIENTISISKNELNKFISRKSEFKLRLSDIEKNISKNEYFIEETEREINEVTVQMDKNSFELEKVSSEKEKNLEDMKFKEETKEKILLDKDNISIEINKIIISRERVDSKLESLKTKLWEDYAMSFIMADKVEKSGKSQEELKLIITDIKKDIKRIGNVNVDSVEELKVLMERYNFLSSQRDDLVDAEASLKYVIKEMNSNMRKQFMEKFSEIKDEFKIVFEELFGGGKADILIEEEEDLLNSGIEIIAEPPGKKMQSLSLLSGGERALTAIALLFSILKTKPTPFCILDEIEAALDEANVYRYAKYLNKLSQDSQFVVITHRKGTMESSDSLYGVTMHRSGISELVSVNIEDKN